MDERALARHFAENLKRQRSRAGISQEELGFLAEIHRTEIGVLERGIRLPRIDTVIKVAGGLELTAPCELLEGIRWRPGRYSPGRFEIEER